MKQSIIVVLILTSIAVVIVQAQSGIDAPKNTSGDIALEKKVANLESRVERLERVVVALAKDAKLGENPVGPVAGAKVVESKIDGDFEGWDGDTIFKLENGQIWQQSSFAFTYKFAFRPKVIIFQKDSRWFMKVDGVEKTIEVKQLK